MPTYDGIGTSITHRVEVAGDSLFQDVDGGTLSTKVPVQIFSNYYASPGSVDSSRQLRFRVQPDGESNVSNSYVTDMGVKGADGSNYFFITAPQNTSNVGDQNTFVISTTSNVGIGTADPKTKLHVSHDLHLQSSSEEWNSTAGPGLYLRYSTYSGQDGGYIQSIDRRTPVTKKPMVLEASNYYFNGGNVGIGTASPTAPLHIESANPQILIGTGGGSGEIYFGNGGHGVGRNTGKTNFTDVNDVLLHTYGSGAAGLQNQGGYLKLSSGGNVGIASASPGKKLDVNGEVRTNSHLIQNSTDGVGYFGQEASTNANGKLQVWCGNSGLAIDGASFRATNDANHIINFMSSGGTLRGKIAGNGSNAVSYVTTSDVRLKENIVDMSSMLDLVMNMKAREFDWKEDKKHSYGFIAQEIFELMPWMRPNIENYCGCDADCDRPCYTDGKEYVYGLDYGSFTPYIIKAFQEYKIKTDAKIETLEARIEALENSS
jgi:hypothetical protein